MSGPVERASLERLACSIADWCDETVTSRSHDRGDNNPDGDVAVNGSDTFWSLDLANTEMAAIRQLVEDCLLVAGSTLDFEWTTTSGDSGSQVGVPVGNVTLPVADPGSMQVVGGASGFSGKLDTLTVTHRVAVNCVKAQRTIGCLDQALLDKVCETNELLAELIGQEPPDDFEILLLCDEDGNPYVACYNKTQGAVKVLNLSGEEQEVTCETVTIRCTGSSRITDAGLDEFRFGNVNGGAWVPTPANWATLTEAERAQFLVDYLAANGFPGYGWTAGVALGFCGPITPNPGSLSTRIGRALSVALWASSSEVQCTGVDIGDLVQCVAETPEDFELRTRTLCSTIGGVSATVTETQIYVDGVPVGTPQYVDAGGAFVAVGDLTIGACPNQDAAVVAANSEQACFLIDGSPTPHSRVLFSDGTYGAWTPVDFGGLTPVDCCTGEPL